MKIDFKDAIKKALTKSSIIGEHIEVRQRAIGKTTALIEFARDYGFTVVVPFRNIRDNLRNKSGYADIIYADELSGISKDVKLVFDEGVNPNLTNCQSQFVTGFISIN
ncbi:TPA: hypothetical protein ACGXNJ_005166 [Bacillus cereus]